MLKESNVARKVLRYVQTDFNPENATPSTINWDDISHNNDELLKIWMTGLCSQCNVSQTTLFNYIEVIMRRHIIVKDSN